MESEKTIPLEMFRTLLNKEWRDLVEKLCTNIVMCFLKSNLYARAHELAQNYIRIFPENPKLKYQDACAL